MILVDTSVWVDHLRAGNPRLRSLLDEGLVLTHPFVLGELACGSLRNRREVLGLLGTLPQVGVADHDEVLALISDRRLYGSGLGWVDMHLIAGALLSDSSLWTLDHRLAAVAEALGLSAARRPRSG